MLVESACEHAHNRDAEVDDTAQDAQLCFVHVVVLLHRHRAGRQDPVVQIYQDVRQDHQREYHRWRLVILDVLTDLLLHSGLF